MPGLQSLVNSRLIEDTPQGLLVAAERQVPTRLGTGQAHCMGQGRVLVIECSDRLGCDPQEPLYRREEQQQQE